MEWQIILLLFLGMWYSLIGGYVKHPYIDENMRGVILAPIVGVFIFGLYSIVLILYRVFTIKNCDEDAKLLQEEILAARAELKEKGITW